MFKQDIKQIEYELLTIIPNETGNKYLCPAEAAVKSGYCPECGIKMVRLGYCFSCPQCGFGSCE